MIKYGAIAFLAFLATVVLNKAVVTLDYNAYKETLGALLNISSIIFAIIGAWIAIIYPRAIGRVFKGEELNQPAIKEARKDTDYLSQLVEIVLVSALVLMVVLIAQFTVPIIQSMKIQSMEVAFKLFGFFVIALLTFSQLYAISRVILANYFFLNELRRKEVEDEVDWLHK
ncbi:hypothetical protein ACONUD_00745 [Microbulbifer harenosus]|uniref:DUF2975 domain-containing protein n=1 Tax=Microbulbifer harenosus TaxID=2576840 RepID=A0ABY2UMU6_9GAMM|nr:hypothetical protein [Microbulbifer harenosus]TLM79937.1 hypothetical protein FDY93_00740 [Microbulbifer harenosus]